MVTTQTHRLEAETETTLFGCTDGVPEILYSGFKPARKLDANLYVQTGLAIARAAV